MDLIALGVLSGLGGHSRLGLLVHREYGPWLSLRALVLTERRFADLGPAEEFEPCSGCPAWRSRSAGGTNANSSSPMKR